MHWAKGRGEAFLDTDPTSGRRMGLRRREAMRRR
jgi:hypothetical protein